MSDGSDMAAPLDFDVVRQAANGCWREILIAFGIEAVHLNNRHGPCPGCGGVDRFRFDDQDGRGTFFCNKADPQAGDGFTLLMHVNGWSVSEAFSEVANYLGVAGIDKAKQVSRKEFKLSKRKPGLRQYALKLWEQAEGGVQFHPYAKKKGILWEAGAQRHRRVFGSIVGKGEDCILVPIRELATDTVVAVQAINGVGRKQTFGPIKGHGFICGNTLDKAIPWYVVEGWADAISMVFHHHKGNACAFAACGRGGMDALTQRVVDVFAPDDLIMLEDAA